MVNKNGCASIGAYFIIFWALVLMIFGCLAGCNPVKKATKHYNKAKQKHLPTVAMLSKQDFPYIPTKADTIINYIKGRTDTVTTEQVIEVPCPDTARNAPANSVIRVPVKVPCRCEEKQPDTLYRYITQFEKDPRDSIVFTEQLQIKDKQISKEEKSKAFWRTAAIVLGIIFALYIILSRIFRLF